MAFQAVIFDLDGTLVDSLGDIGGALNAVLARRGLPVHPILAYRQLVGEGVQNLVRRALPKEQGHLVDPVRAEYLAAYEERMLRTTVPYEGVTQLLHSLRHQGLKLAVLSNKPAPATEQLVSALFEPGTFQAVLGESPRFPRKPAPEGARFLAEQLGVVPGETLFVGDSGVDMQTALGAGMFPVGVLWGLRDSEELQAAGAKALLNHPVELPSLLV